MAEVVRCGEVVVEEIVVVRGIGAVVPAAPVDGAVVAVEAGVVVVVAVAGSVAAVVVAVVAAPGEVCVGSVVVVVAGSVAVVAAIVVAAAVVMVPVAAVAVAAVAPQVVAAVVTVPSAAASVMACAVAVNSVAMPFDVVAAATVALGFGVSTPLTVRIWLLNVPPPSGILLPLTSAASAMKPWAAAVAWLTLPV